MANARHTLSIEAQGERELVIVRAFDAPKALVFRAFTEADLVVKWLGTPETPLVSARIDLRPGGAIRYAWKGESGFTMVMTGRFVEVSAPDRLVHTEVFDEDWTGGEAHATTVFTEDNGTTTVTLTMRYASKEAREAVARSPMEQGMATNYDTLERLLAAGALADAPSRRA